ncbi:hypothetical protein SAY87_025461 [Trapa incisa]|uniref:Uncharacterized protein n=1 Tax=Trapa incisa TaxID=236973 RepID=A0AAN7GLH3_9MYRT|nr:hypothetical protein SAY87_025461 [Trapa incisa]
MALVGPDDVDMAYSWTLSSGTIPSLRKPMKRGGGMRFLMVPLKRQRHMKTLSALSMHKTPKPFTALKNEQSREERDRRSRKPNWCSASISAEIDG